MLTGPGGLGQGLSICISRAASAGVGVKTLGSPCVEALGKGQQSQAGLQGCDVRRWWAQTHSLPAAGDTEDSKRALW